MTTPTNVRFPDEINRRVLEYAARTGAAKSAVVVDAVDEWLQMQEHPRIVFVTTNTGERRAALTSGPQVWTVAESWRQHDPGERSPAVVAHALGLSTADVEAALSYWADHRGDIDRLVDTHQSAQDDALAAWERRRGLDRI